MDVLDARVVHAARTPRLGVQSRFEHRPENRGAYLAPVETVARLLKKQTLHLIVKLRDLNLLFREESAVHIRKRRQVGVNVRISFRLLRVENLEKINQCLADIPRLETLEVVMELVLCSEDSRILGIQTKDKPYAEFVQAFECFFSGRITVSRQDCVVYLPDELTRLDGNLHLALQMRLSGIDKERKAVAFLR